MSMHCSVELYFDKKPRLEELKEHIKSGHHNMIGEHQSHFIFTDPSGNKYGVDKMIINGKMCDDIFLFSFDNFDGSVSIIGNMLSIYGGIVQYGEDGMHRFSANQLSAMREDSYWKD